MYRIIYSSRLKEVLKNLERKFENFFKKLSLKSGFKLYNIFNNLYYYIKKPPSQKGFKIDNSHIYLTLKCNLRCAYCANGKYYDKSSMGYKERNPEFWIDKINGLKQDTIIFTGGEPLLYNGLIKIINNIKKPKILVYTNLSIKNFEKIIRDIKKQVHWWISYHPGGGGDLNLILKNIEILKKYHQSFLLHSIPAKENLKIYNNTTKVLLKRHKVDLLVKETIQNHLNVDMRDVKCQIKARLYAPDGNRFHCVYSLITKNPDYIINHQNLISVIICSKYGECSPCDEVAEIKFLD